MPDDGQLRVVVVEDDEDLREIYVIFLTAAGFHAESFESVRDAAAHLGTAAGRADVVVTDLHLPGEDGRDLVAVLRDRGVPVPVIALTGDYLDQAAPFASVLRKPVTAEQLERAVRSASGSVPSCGDTPGSVTASGAERVVR